MFLRIHTTKWTTYNLTPSLTPSLDLNIDLFYTSIGLNQEIYILEYY